jgi:hypothetical protein
MKIQKIDRLPYSINIKVSVALILLLLITVFKFAPNFQYKKGFSTFQSNIDQITLDLIEITVQERSVPPPPRPRVQVAISNPRIIDDNTLDQILDFEYTSQLIPLPSSGISTGNIVRNPQSPARVQRIVEPVGPSDGTLQQIRAEIVAQLTVNVSGRVEDVEILEIKIYNRRTRSFDFADEIDNYFIESTIAAAMQWQFRAATQDGVAVRSVSRHVFTFGSGIN